MKSTILIKELRKMSHKDLEAKIADIKKQLADSKYDFANGLVKNTKTMQNIKRDLARALTIQKEGQLVKLAETEKEGEK